MRWIKEQVVFEKILVDARQCVETDKARAHANLCLLVFDSSELCTDAFARLLRQLAIWSDDILSYYLVLDPDPVEYFLAFGKYPLLEIRNDDSTDVYIAVLNEDSGGSPADAIGVNWYEYSVLPVSKAWFIYAVRDDLNNEGGHLWIPEEWKTRVREIYPYATPPNSE